MLFGTVEDVPAVADWVEGCIWVMQVVQTRREAPEVVESKDRTAAATPGCPSLQGLFCQRCWTLQLSMSIQRVSLGHSAEMLQHVPGCFIIHLHHQGAAPSYMLHHHEGIGSLADRFIDH